MALDDTDIGDPASLKKAGSGAIDLAGDTKMAGSRPIDETQAAAKDFSGGNWEGGLGKALTEVARTWARQSSALQASCVEMGNQFRETSNNYSSGEEENVSVIQRVESERSPFG